MDIDHRYRYVLYRFIVFIRSVIVFDMNLSEYMAMPKRVVGSSEFLKWTQNGEAKILRFLYTSHDGSDIPVVKKIWSDEQKKFLYDTPDGKLTCVLDCVLYEEGKEPKRVRWERSAAFVEQVCNGYWSKFPRIIDGVWEVTCTNPGTKEIRFSWFPVMGADLTSYPLPADVEIKNGQVVTSDQILTSQTSAGGTLAQESRPKKYWEE